MTEISCQYKTRISLKNDLGHRIHNKNVYLYNPLYDSKSIMEKTYHPKIIFPVKELSGK